MKKNYYLILILSILFLLPVNIFAQVIEISPFYGWQMNGKMRFYEGDIKTDDNELFGGTMDIEIAHGYGVELMYSHTKTHSYFYPSSSSYTRRDFDVINEYYQIGSYKYMEYGNLQPFMVLSLGAARYAPSDNDISDIWRFAMTFALGTKIFFSDKVGIRLQGALMMPMYFSGVGFYFGTGGSGLTTYSYVPMVQGNFNAGLIFRLGK